MEASFAKQSDSGDHNANNDNNDNSSMISQSKFELAETPKANMECLDMFSSFK